MAGEFEVRFGSNGPNRIFLSASCAEMNFRPLTLEDIPETIEVRGATRENPISRAELGGLGITEESVAALLRTTHQGWICEKDRKVIGFAIGDGKTGELWVIAVLPDYEGKGIGSHLLKLVEDWLWSLGWSEIWLWTSADKTRRAFSFYSNRGWSVSRVEGDILFMKRLSPGVRDRGEGQAGG